MAGFVALKGEEFQVPQLIGYVTILVCTLIESIFETSYLQILVIDSVIRKAITSFG